MKFTFSNIAAGAALLPSFAFAHIGMNQPPSVFSDNDGTFNFPIHANGDDFPCTVHNFQVSDSLVPTYQPGSQQSIGLMGSAVHGGGSCQISFTYDYPPTPNSVFRVVKSFEGGCPINAPGNLPANPTNQLPPLPFTVPSDMPSGPCVLAWTWFNRIGNREMYMRCAKVNIGGSNTDSSGFSKLPEIFKANIGSLGNGCITKEGINIKFANPGSDLVGTGDAYPDGPGCPQPGTSSPPTQNPPAQNPPAQNPPAQTPSAQTPSAQNTPAQTPPAQTPPAQNTPAQAPPAQTPPAQNLPAQTTPAQSPPAQSPPAQSPPAQNPHHQNPHHQDPHAQDPHAQDPHAQDPSAIYPVLVQNPSPTAPPSNQPSNPPQTSSPAETSTSAPSSTAGSGGPCSNNGAIYCTSSTTWSMCNFNKLQDMGPTAQGTNCVDGKIVSTSSHRKLKRAVRFSVDHLRRRHHHSNL